MRETRTVLSSELDVPAAQEPPMPKNQCADDPACTFIEYRWVGPTYYAVYLCGGVERHYVENPPPPGGG